MTPQSDRKFPLDKGSSDLKNASAASRVPAQVAIGIAGLGGYAGYICEAVRKVSSKDPEHAPSRLVAVCEPDLTLHAEKVTSLRAAGITVHGNYADLLREPIDAVWLPIPIHLHRSFTEQAIAAGKAVLCEKPAAGSVQEVDAMIAARDRSGLPVAIGYQHLCDPAILEIKRRLLAGEIGRITGVTVVGCWPRDSGYFSRNDWAGQARHDGIWILDSPLANAMSHYLQLALFLVGPRERETAVATRVEAELYRANPIENFDTCSLRISTGTSTLAILMTHASATNVDPQIKIIGEKGCVIMHPENRIELQCAGGSTSIPLSSNAQEQLLTSFCRWVRGLAPEGTIATLEIARAPVVVVNATSQAAPVRTVPEEYVEMIQQPNGRTLRAIRGIEALFEACAAEGKMLHELGNTPWTSVGGALSIGDYREFHGPRTS